MVKVFQYSIIQLNTKDPLKNNIPTNCCNLIVNDKMFGEWE